MFKQNLIVKPNKFGNGVFTKTFIPQGLPILEIKGNIYNKENLPNHSANFQIGNDSFIGPSGEIDDELNHSCDPNCYLCIVGQRAVLHSLYDIREDNELTIDYSVSSTENLQMKCFCSSYKCRKNIGGILSLPKELKKEYEQKNIIPLFIGNKMFR